MNRFNPDDLKNPLYEYSQIITPSDLQTIYKGLMIQYNFARWWEFRLRYDATVAMRSILELLGWIYNGKAKLRELK